MKANADILPTFLIDGFVAGRWSIDGSAAAAIIRLEPFAGVAPKDRRALEAEAERLVRYHEPEASRYEVAWAD